MIVHHFTVDVEEYYHPTALSRSYPFAGWPALPRRSPGVIDRLLAFLGEREVMGTFFVLGWLAEREPEMVRAISRAGHEVASHGYAHRPLGEIGPEKFRESIRRSKGILEDTAGQEILGYRAPSFSVTPGREWAFDLLLEEGYRYDASIFPIRQHPTYGYPDVPRDPFWIQRSAGRLAEFPATTVRLLGSTLPAAGGAYFRLLPYGLVRAGLRQAEARRSAGMFYIHPWELDDWAPTPAVSRLQRFRTFYGRHRTWNRLDRMFAQFRFGPVNTSVDAVLQGPAGLEP